MKINYSKKNNHKKVIETSTNTYNSLVMYSRSRADVEAAIKYVYRKCNYDGGLYLKLDTDPERGGQNYLITPIFSGLNSNNSRDWATMLELGGFIETAIFSYVSAANKFRRNDKPFYFRTT